MVFLGRSSSLAVLALASSSLAAPSPLKPEPEFHTLLGYPADDFVVDWVGPKPEYVTIKKEDLAKHNVTSAAPLDISTSALAERAIFGADDRQLWPNTEYPYSAIGKIQWSNGVFCSGTLVGPRHVATAKHCAPGAGTSVSIRFSPNFYDSERAGGAYVTTIISLAGYDVNDNPDACDWKEDWAIFILDGRLGDNQGYFGAKLIDDSLTNQPIFFNYGYPGDLANGARPYRSSGSTVQPRPYSCDDYGPYSTDTDVAGGQSGGPFWQYEGDSRYLYAICSGSSSANSIFSGGNNLVSAIIAARNDFP